MLISSRWVPQHSRRLYSTTKVASLSTSTGLGSQKFRILFCGSDEFSVRNLDKLLIASDVWESVHVLTPRLRKSPIHYAKQKGISTSQVPAEGINHYTFPSADFNTGKTNDSISSTSVDEKNVLVTASFGHIIPNSFLARFAPSKRLNVHPSLLPHYRGAAPIQWTIANGDVSTGVSVQRLVEKGKGIDGGDVVGSVDGIQVKADATYRSLLEEVSEIGGDLLVDVLRKIQTGTDEGHPQDPDLVTRAPKITHDTARIRWSDQTAQHIERLSRGISHQYSLWTTSNGTPIQLFGLSIPDVRLEQEVEAGIARLIRKEGKMVIACAEGTWIQVQRVKSQGKKEVGVNDWWNGLPKDIRESKEILLH